VRIEYHFLRGLTPALSGRANSASPDPLQRLVRPCTGSPRRHVCDNPRKRLPGHGGLRIHTSEPPRVLALVEKPDDGGLCTPLLEGERRHDHEIDVKCPALPSRVHYVEHLVVREIQPLDLALKGW